MLSKRMVKSNGQARKTSTPILLGPDIFQWGGLGARPRGHTATQRSKKGSVKLLGRVLGKGFSEKGSEKGDCYGFYSKKKGSEKGSQKGF